MKISKTVPPGIVMANVGHWHVDKGGSTVDSEAAEQRLEDGLCGACGLEIAVERLDELPATPTCVNCAR